MVKVSEAIVSEAALKTRPEPEIAMLNQRNMIQLVL